MSSEEFEVGKQAFIDLVNSLDRGVELVIPVTPSRGNFLISLTKGKARKFISVNEDDLIDLPEDDGIRRKLTDDVKTVLAEFAAP